MRSAALMPFSLLTDEKPEPAEIIGNNDKEMKQRRE